jgi:hypothetical protein
MFLLSDAGRAVTAEVLMVDGAITRRGCSATWRNLCLIILTAASLSVSISADWPAGGGRRPGAFVNPLPTEWDSANNIAWKVSIPGRGFSSPIVSGDSVYVSTAYAKDGFSPKTAAGAALLVAAVLLTAAALRDIAGRLRDPGPLAAFAVAVVLLSILCLEWVVIASGETLLDFARCPIRGWLASAGMATLVFASLLLTDDSRPARICQIVAGVALSAAILPGVPTKEYAFAAARRIPA